MFNNNYFIKNIIFIFKSQYLILKGTKKSKILNLKFTKFGLKSKKAIFKKV